jgi:dTDP-4-dehydrorhamnose reductase
MIAIFGSNGYLGKAISSIANLEMLKLTHKCKSDDEIFFNLNNYSPDLKKTLFEKISIAIICIGKGDLEYCAQNKQTTWDFNVRDISNLIALLNEAKVKIIYLSSDAVFQGTIGDYSELDIRRPVLTYGLQKKTMENYIITKVDNYLIVRLSKVYDFHDKNSFIKKWEKRLSEGYDLKILNDYFFTPIYKEDVVRILVFLILNSSEGIFHVSGPNTTTYSEIFKAFIEKSDFSKSKSKIHFINRSQLKLSEAFPRNLSLNSSKLTNIYPAEIRSIFDVL